MEKGIESLSEKIVEYDDASLISAKKVKEAVRLLKKEIVKIELDWLEDTTDSPFLMTKAIRKTINKIFGKNLI